MQVADDVQCASFNSLPPLSTRTYPSIACLNMKVHIGRGEMPPNHRVCITEVQRKGPVICRTDKRVCDDFYRIASLCSGERGLLGLCLIPRLSVEHTQERTKGHGDWRCDTESNISNIRSVAFRTYVLDPGNSSVPHSRQPSGDSRKLINSH